MTNDCNRWLERLLEEGAPANVLKEFKILYSELMLGIATNDSFTKDEIFDVIKSIGNSNADAVDAKIYLAYVIGKFQAADAYATTIGGILNDDTTEDTMLFIDKLMDDAVKEIINR